MTSWIEEIVARYYQKKGYFVILNHNFLIPREKSGKKVSGWSDIDVLAYNGHEIHIVQCKAFLGDKKSEESAKRVINWFKVAEEYLRESDYFKPIFSGSHKLAKVLVVNVPQPKKAIRIVEENGIEVLPLEDVIVNLITLMDAEIHMHKRRGHGNVGKEDDVLLAFIRELLLRDMIKLPSKAGSPPPGS